MTELPVYDFTSRASALAELKGADPTVTLVLTDMWMPEMNGAELAAAIRADAALRDVPVVAVTADADSGRTFDITLFDSVLTKPVTGERMRELIKSLYLT